MAIFFKEGRIKHAGEDPIVRIRTAFWNKLLHTEVVWSCSEQGTKNISLNTTITKTTKLNGLDPIEFLKTFLTKDLTPELSKHPGLPEPRPP